MQRLELVARIGGLESISFAGEAFPHTSPGMDPLSTTGSRMHGGRWNPPGVAALYCALDPATVADEWYRAAERQGLAPEGFLPRTLHRVGLRLTALLDLRSPSAQETVGLGESQLRGLDLRACQAVGEAAHSLGREGIIAPSAAGPGVVLAVFVEALRPPSQVEVVSSQIWDAPPPRRL